MQTIELTDGGILLYDEAFLRSCGVQFSLLARLGGLRYLGCFPVRNNEQEAAGWQRWIGNN